MLLRMYARQQRNVYHSRCILRNVYRVKRKHNDCECYNIHSPYVTSTPTRDHLSEDTFAVFVLSQKLTATSLIGYTLSCSSVLFKFPTVDSFYLRRRASKMTHKTAADLISNQDVAPSEAYALC